MKKLLFISIIGLITSSACYSQNAYYDALKLKKTFLIGNDGLKIKDSTFILLSDIKPLYEILNNYIKSPSTNSDSIKKAFKWNPFIRFDTNANGMKDALSTDLSRGIGSIGGFDITNIANGIAQFMIKRAKEELTISFFNRFQKFSASHPEFQALFPKTSDNLKNLLSYKYPEMLPSLRNNFYDDLQNITDHLSDVLELPKYQPLLQKFPEIGVTIRSIKVIKDMEAGALHPADALKEFAAFKEFQTFDGATSNGFNNFASSVKLAGIFSESLRSVDSTNTNIKVTKLKGWISYKQVKGLVTDSITFRIYLGLLYQKIKSNSIIFYSVNNQNKNINFADLMALKKDNLLLFEKKLTEFIAIAQDVDTAITQITQKKNLKTKLTDSDYYNYINKAIDAINYGLSVAKLFDNDLDAKLDNYTAIATKSNELYRDIYKKQYNQAILSAVNILNTVVEMVNDNKDQLVQHVNNSLKLKNRERGADSLKNAPQIGASTFGTKYNFKNLGKADTVTINALIKQAGNKDIFPELNRIKSLYESSASLNKFTDIISNLTQYGLFIANIANAKTPDEVQSVLESAVLPVGSSSIKKNSVFNFSVQSYLGAYLNGLGTPKNTINSTWGNKFGVTAPIGLSISTGLWNKAGSISLFGSLFDLGAIVDYQLTKDSVSNNSGTSKTTTQTISKDYKVKIGQIFSPGAYIVYGMAWNIPLSLGFGGQYGPGLSKINTLGTSTTTGNVSTVVNNPQWRWNVFLSVDIPFFTISNKTKNYK